MGYNKTREFKYFDGECYVTFNLVDIDFSKREVYVAVTNRGRITLNTFDLYRDKNEYYFEYGPEYTKIKIKEFLEYFWRIIVLYCYALLF